MSSPRWREENLVELTPLVGRDALRLQAIARSLHHLAEADANYGLTPRQETRYYNLVAEAREIARSHRLVVYHQTDPRGWPLYLLRPAQVNKGENIRAIYNRGVAVCPH